MAAGIDRELKMTLMSLADSNPKIRIQTLQDIKMRYRSASADKMQEAYDFITTKLSYEKSPDVNHALAELRASWYPPAPEPRNTTSNRHIHQLPQEDDIIELDLPDDDFAENKLSAPAPAIERASSRPSSQSTYIHSIDLDLDGPSTQEFSQKAAPSSHALSRTPSGSIAPSSHNTSINRSSIPSRSTTPPSTGIENDTATSQRTSSNVAPAHPPLSRAPSATSSTVTSALNQPQSRLLPPSFQSTAPSTLLSSAPPAQAPQPSSPPKDAFGIMMAKKKRQSPSELESAPTAKRAKKAASAMQSTYRPPAGDRQSFLDNRHTLGSSTPLGSAPSTNSSAMAFSGYSDTGMPATHSAPTRGSSGLTLQPHTTSKDMVPQRSIGVMSTSPFASAQPLSSATYHGQAAPTASSKLPPASNAAKPRQPFGVLEKTERKTGFNNGKAFVGRSTVNSLGFSHPIDISKTVFDTCLSQNQRLIVEKALNGESFFFTGAAGTGKSFVLKEIIRIMKDAYKPEELQIMAPTGMAAIELGGWTINAFAGIGLGEGERVDLLKKVKDNPKSRNRWRQAAVLIIDEVSMMSASLFEKLQYIADEVRGKGHGPFGGLQLIMCGDFFQLPPVNNQKHQAPAPVPIGTFPTAAPVFKKYAFESDSWKKCVANTYTLTEIFRQVGDAAFVSMLNEIRVGVVSDATFKALNSCKRSFRPSNPLLPPVRNVVASLEIVNGPTGAWQTKALAPEKAIEPTRLFPKKAAVYQYNETRLRSIAGEQFDFLSIDDKIAGADAALKSLQEHCPAPTKLSLKENAQVILLRNKTQQGLVNGSRGTVVGFHLTEEKKRLPIVRFESSLEEHLIETETWTVEQNGVVMASRVQIPLALAWAISIHKSQGMTISQVEVALNEVFEAGQAYVALSRVTSLAGLVITDDFKREVIRADASVVNFYNSLQRV